jgi:hypothetical protein
MSGEGPTTLQLLAAEAAAGLDAAARGVPVCVATKSGTPAPGVKYHEGRWAALNEVARRCRRTSEDVTAVATAVRLSWADELLRLTERAAGADWIAYREGGTDALTDLLARSIDAATAVTSE